MAVSVSSDSIRPIRPARQVSNCLLPRGVHLWLKRFSLEDFNSGVSVLHSSEAFLSGVEWVGVVREFGFAMRVVKAYIQLTKSICGDQ